MASGTDGNLKKKITFQSLNEQWSFTEIRFDSNYIWYTQKLLLFLWGGIKKKDYKRDILKVFYITVTFPHILYLWKPCYVCTRKGLSLGEQIIYLDFFEGGGQISGVAGFKLKWQKQSMVVALRRHGLKIREKWNMSRAKESV